MSSGNPLSIIDLSGISKPITKLIETVAGAIGVLYEPKQIVRKARAEKEAAIIQAEAEVEISKIRLQAKREEEEQGNPQNVISLIYRLSSSQDMQNDVQVESIETRAQRRITAQAIRRQLNNENIINKAVRYLPDMVSDDKVDEDWIGFFFNYAQDVSNINIQTIWAKLLAGEVAKPGTFSLRALSALRLFNQYEAKIFSDYCRQVTTFYKVVSSKDWINRKHVFAYNEKEASSPEKFAVGRLETIKPSYYAYDAVNDSPETMILESLGLILKVPSNSFFFNDPEHEGVLFEYCGKRHILLLGSRSRVYFSEFTPVGSELASLVDGAMDQEYLEKVSQFFKKPSFSGSTLIPLEP